MKRKTDVLLPYFLIAPGIAIVFFVYIWPLILGFIWSLQYKFLLRPDIVGWVGLGNYIDNITDPRFWKVMYTTFVYAGGSVIINFILGLSVALALNRPLRGRDIFRGIILIPWMLPPAVVAITSRWILDGMVGPVSDLMLRFGLIKEPIYLLGSPKWALPTLIFLTSWRSFPFVAVMLLAALQTIPVELYEAARVDGAGIWYSFTSITLPSIKSTIILSLLLSFVWNFNFMDFSYIITQGGPLSTTEVMPLYIYRTMFQKYQFGLSCSLSFLCLFIIMVFMYFYIKILWGDKTINE